MSTTSSSRPVDDARTSNVEQDYPPLVPNYHLDGFPLSGPLQHALPSIPLEPGSGFSCDPLDPSIPSFTSYPNPSLGKLTAHNPVPPGSFANGGTQYDIPSPVQPHFHQAVETVPFGSFAPPHSISPLATLHSQSLPEPTHVVPDAMGALNQTQAQAASSSSTFHVFGGNAATLPAPPVPPTPANPTPAPSNTIHICQWVTDGLPCNAAVGGSTRAVRDHFKRVHGFRCVGKDPVVCLWAGCGETLQRENIPRHVLRRHLRVGASCVRCSLPLSRPDVQYSHARACPARRRRF